MSIRSELEVRLSQFASSQTPAIPVSYENSKFTKPKSGPYLEIMLLKSTALNRQLSAQGKRIYGKAQINVYAPLGTGMAFLEDLVNKVVNLYPVVPKVGIVSIEKPCDEGSSYILDNFICIPITVSYRVEQ